VSTCPESSDDIRMKGFARRSTVAEALAWLDAHVARLDEEVVLLAEAAGRVLAGEVTSAVNVPGFDRAMMDGFALRAADTQGASPYNRIALTVIGESLPGRGDCPNFRGHHAQHGRENGTAPFLGSAEGDSPVFADTKTGTVPLAPGQAVRIMTGAPMPDGADAVLPAELVEIEAGRVCAQGEVSPGKHVGRVGEDIAAGSVVLPAGRVLRPQDIGVLASIGMGDVPVVRRPRVRIVITGDELLPAGSTPVGCRIVDANGPMLAALVARDGGMPINPGIVADRPEEILAAMRTDCDVLLVSGGSSVGQEDHAPRLLREYGELAIHGIAMRPSSPAGMGRMPRRAIFQVAPSGGQDSQPLDELGRLGKSPYEGQRLEKLPYDDEGVVLVFLLPGNPVSCLCAYDFFAGRAIRGLGGRAADWPYRRTAAPLARKVVSTVGRLDYLRVRLVAGQVEPLAIGGASVLSSTTRADGFVLVPPDSEGYPPGAIVELFLYDM
jgi:molybdopterin molybdotransferase